ncbi:uncharacterized protein LOC130675376 isoform X2 [Microplitis mediator]|uniref:uncharacterized protein LOC130675376 isoform X2 n=1 Tax=Microplitis mediator TaxID=375433 RepID=UPI0025564311|nr:uncharacterized protein LOC130675376 isoform X2 [Microplitis mediator]
MELGVTTDTGGAVACPVCTLYLREGISLQRHLDTHPKEQVIEALIKASGSSSNLSSLQLPQTQVPQVPQTLQPSPPQQQVNAQSSTSAPTAAAVAAAHIPTQAPFPIGPVFECPPINAMMPPQFASFNYQQFVNNGTMMIPQYAMAPPQANQMMQMLYNPYMYQQQQVPTVQMISPVSALPTTRIRPVVTVANTETTRNVMISTSTNEPKQIIPEMISEANMERILPDMDTCTNSNQQSTENTTDIRHDDHDGDNLVRQLDHRDQQTQSNSPRRVADNSEVVRNDAESAVPEEEKSESILPDMEEPEVDNTGDQCRNEQHLQQDQEHQTFSSTYNQIDSENSGTDTRLNQHRQEQDKFETQEPSNIEKLNSSKSIESQINSAQTPMVLETCQQNEEEHLEHLLITMIESGFVETHEQTNVVHEPNSESNLKTITTQNEEQMEEEEEQEEEEEIEEEEEEDDDGEEQEEESQNNFTTIDETKYINDSEACVEREKCIDTIIIDECDLDYAYRYRHSLSAPASPVSASKKISRPYTRSECGSTENLNFYPAGFDATALQVDVDHEDDDEENDDDEDDDDDDDDEEEEEEEEEEEAKRVGDNFDEEDMEIEEIASPHTPFIKQNDDFDNARSHTPLSAISGISGLRVRSDLSKPSSPVSMRSFDHMEGDSHDEESTDSITSQKHQVDCSQVDHSVVRSSHDISEGACIDAVRKSENNTSGIFHQSVITEHVSSFPAIHSQQSITNDNYSISNSKIITRQSDLSCGLSQTIEPTTTSIESKSFQSTLTKTVNNIPTTELLNINEDAHSGPMNVFEFDGLQILVPSTFISESSQKAISATSQQSMASSEGGAGIDEEVKSVNMRADETMPPRGELSEQESNGCTEHSAWQLYVGQESSRMSTSYDLMARESWEESEGSDNEAGVPLLDSRSLATHFTSSLFLDRDRKTPTKQRTFKCSQCSEVFDCPKERRVHSTTVHKEAGPSNSCSNSDIAEQSETKDIKLLDGPMNPFEDIFVPGIHVQQAYQQQQPLLHQMQPPQQLSDISKVETDEKTESLALTQGIEISCAMCTQRFSSERSLQMHNRRVHGTEVARRLHDISKCQICNEEFPSVALFNAHLKIHPLECSQCGKYFYRKQNFKLHMKRHLGIKPFPCTVCDKAFLTKQKLDEHMNGHTGNAPVKCNLCNETFRRYSNLTQHKNRHHLNIKRKLKDYICHCGEVFHTKKKLAWHKETHDEKPKACTYCNERFIHMASLTRHMRRAHNRRFVPDAQRENENVECPICKCIYLRSSLSVHMRVHNGERPYECQVCSKAFSTKWNLQLHKWTHAARSTKPFKCNQCSAAFYRHSDYTAHMNSHRNVRPYTCNYCGAQFIRKYNCLRHVKEHEENKAYTCDVCNKTFHRSYYLKEHLRVHSGARPYACHICGKSSSTKSNHNKHVRIHHAREPVNTEN